MVSYLSDTDINDIFNKIFEFKSSKRLRDFLNLQESTYMSQSKGLWEGLEERLKNSYENKEEDQLGYIYSNEELKDAEQVKAFFQSFLFEKSEQAFQRHQSLAMFSDIKHIDKLLKSIKANEKKIEASSTIRKLFFETNVLKFHRKIEEIRSKFSLLNVDEILELNQQELLAFIKVYFSVKKNEYDYTDKLIYQIPNEDCAVCLCSTKLEMSQVFYHYSQYSGKDYYSFQRMERKIWSEVARRRGKEILEVEKMLKDYIRITDLPLNMLKDSLAITYSFMLPIGYRQELTSIISSFNDFSDFLYSTNNETDLVDLLTTTDYRKNAPIKFTKETSILYYFFHKIDSSFKEIRLSSGIIERSKKFFIYPNYNSLLTKVDEKKFVLLSATTFRQAKSNHLKKMKETNNDEFAICKKIDEVFARYLK